MRKDRPSRSAVQVGQMQIFLAQDERYAPLLCADVVDATERLLTAAGALKPWHVKLLRKRWYRKLLHKLEGLGARGHFLHIGLRKRFVDDQARAALDSGAKQVLVIGAGMDTLCLRLAPRYSDVLFIELDHPASQRAKRKALDALGGAPENVHLVASDLTEETPLDEIVATCEGWSADAPSFALTEGLLMYLPEPAVDRLAAAIHRATGPGSRWLLTYMHKRPDGSLDLGKMGKLMGAGMKLSGEAIVWGLREQDVAAFLEQRGFRLTEPLENFDLRHRYLEPAGMGDEPLGRLERVALAERVEQADQPEG